MPHGTLPGMSAAAAFRVGRSDAWLPRARRARTESGLRGEQRPAANARCTVDNVKSEERHHGARAKYDARRGAALVAGALVCACLVAPCMAATSTAAVARAIARRYFHEGLSCAHAGHYHQAIRSFRTATVYDGTLAEAYLNLGACYERLNQFNHGRQYYEKALELDKDNPQLHYMYGAALGRNGDVAGAVAHLERAVYLAPGNVDYLYNLGVAYAGVTQYLLAASCFEQVAGIASNNSVVWYNVGLARLRLGQTNAAEAAFERVELDAPVSAEALYHRAVLAYARGAYTTAVQRAKMAAAVNPALWEADVLRADAHAALGEYREACGVLERVYLLQATSALGSKLAGFYKRWGDEARSNGQYRVALDRYRQAVRFVPTDAEAYLAAAACALAAGDVACTRAELERARRHACNVAHEEQLQLIEQAVRAQEGAAGGARASSY